LLATFGFNTPKGELLKKYVLAFAILLSFLTSYQALAQENLRVPTCYDVNGDPVRFVTIQDPSHGPAFSADYKGYPTIFVNWAEMKKYASSDDTARFIFEHECGHCKLGHIYHQVSTKKTNSQELAADCYAAKQMKVLGIDLRSVEKDVVLLPRDPDHPAGPVRAANIEKCYNKQ
jgi:hypothetical protein